MSDSLFDIPFRYRLGGLLCRLIGHKREPFEAWFGPAGAPDEEGTFFDLAICGRCLTNLPERLSDEKAPQGFPS